MLAAVDEPFGPMALIADPAAGGGRVGDQLPAVRRWLAGRGSGHELLVAERPANVTSLTREAMMGGHRYVVAVGDDGTVHAVVNGMFQDDRPVVPDPVLGVVAAGAGSDLLRCFGLPRDTAGGLQHLRGELTYPFDLIKLRCTGPDGAPTVGYMHNVAEVGLWAHVAARAARLPGRLGNARRFLAFWGSYVTYRTPRVRIAIDARDRDATAWAVIVGNGQFSGGLRVSPRSFPGDGVLDVLAFTGPKSDAYTLLPRIYRHGDHVPDPNVLELRARIRAAIEPDRPVPVVADGIVVGTTPVTFQVVPQAIRLKL
jgi:diacylglycerol kinase (ATP)